MRQDYFNEEAQIKEFVSQLRDVFEKIAVTGETDPADREAVRIIGWQINESGITRGMRKVAIEFAAQMPQHARRLDMLWDGVGSWMG